MPFRELVSRDAQRLALAGGAVDYVLVRRRGRRGVSLKVDEKGLVVSAPVTMPLSRIEQAVRDSEAWVLRKVREWSTRQVPARTWQDGAALPFMGDALALRLATRSRARVERQGSELWVEVPAGSADAVIRQQVIAWYKRAAAAHLQPRVAELAASAGLAPPKLFISSALGRWGSCNTRREIRLTWRLMKAPVALIDYVVCHELAHLRHMNHSPAFWAEVERQCADYRVLRRQLLSTDHLYRSF